MFEFITNTEERGQVGIGTLIVFIAMVLVAAIAAGVLINTAGFLQTQAEATGQDSTDLVSERIDVSSAVGIVGDSDNGLLDQVRLTVSGAPGADDIDLGDTTIQAVGPGGQQNLVFASGAVADNGVSIPDGTNNTDAPAEVNEYTDSIDVGVSTFSPDDETLRVNVTDGNGNFDKVDVDPSNGEDNSIITVQLTNISASEAQGDTVDIALEDSAGNTVTNGSGTSQTSTADVIASANSDVESSVDADTIDAPSELDEDATAINVSVNNGTSANSLNVSSDGTEINSTTDLPDGQSFVVVELDGTAAEYDTLEVTLEDADTDVLDTDTTTVVDSVQTVDDLRLDEFAVQEDGNYEPTAVIGSQDQYTVVLNPEVGALKNGAAFGEGDSATLDLVSPAGAATQVEINAPDLFTEAGEAVRL